MGRIRCVECGKVWEDQSAYKDDPGCDRGWCLNSEELVMGRRTAGRRGNKPPHINVLELNRPKKDEEVAEPVAVGRKRFRLQTHATTSQVLSRDLDEVGQLELTVSDAININIFVRR